MPKTKTPRLRAVLAVLACAGAVLMTVHPAVAKGGDNGQKTGDKAPVYDFSDTFYLKNGVNPAGLEGRRNGTDGLSVVATSPDSAHRGVRVTFTLPAYDTSGGHDFFTVLADVKANGFTNDAAGRKAKALAESSIVYVFPTRTGDQTAVSNNRQADVVDLSGGYFSNNPVALWKHVFVSWTAKIDTPAGKARIADLTARNGLALDGTAVVKTKSEIDSLVKDGYAKLLERPDGTTGRYFICPVFKDPRKGAITRDAFLATVRRADGTPLPAEQSFVDEFTSLQTTGR